MVNSNLSTSKAIAQLSAGLEHSNSLGLSKPGIAGSVYGNQITLRVTGQILNVLYRPRLKASIKDREQGSQLVGVISVALVEKVIALAWFLFCIYIAWQGSFLIGLTMAVLYVFYMAIGWYVSLGEEDQILSFVSEQLSSSNN